MISEAHPEQSLREYLTTKNPELVTYDCPKGKSTSSRHWTQPLDIKIWEEFTFDNLERNYRRILETRHSLQDFHEIPLFPFREISDEHSLERFLSKWTQSVVCAALEVGQQSHSKIYMASGGQAGFRFEEAVPIRNSAGVMVPKYYPDWAAVKKDTTRVMSRKEVPNLLPGDTKLGTIWDSSKIPKGRFSKVKHRHKDVLPILQILNYCLYSRSSFGYLLTDREVVVVRIKLQQCSENVRPAHLEQHDTQNESFQDSIIEFQAIPWTAFGDRCLTVNLALWWLHLMANEDDTTIETDQEMADVSLNETSMHHNPNDSQQITKEPQRSLPTNTPRKRKRLTEDSISKESSNRRSNGRPSHKVDKGLVNEP